MKSYQYPAAVRDHSKTKRSVQHVLLTLATYVDDNGECFPSYAELEKVTGLSLNTVRRAISAIPADEMVIIEKGKAVGRPSRYRIIINERSTADCANGGHISEVNCAHGEHSQNGDCAHGEHRTMPKNVPNYAHGGTLTTQELPIELPKERKRAPGCSSASSSSDTHKPQEAEDPPVPPSLQTPAFLAAWHGYDAHRRKLNAKSWTAQAKKLALQKCEQWGAIKGADSLNGSVMNGWLGIFEPRDSSDQKPKRDKFGLPPL